MASIVLRLAAAEQTRDLPVAPVVFGVSVFVLFAALVVAVLMFGKGRPHA